MLPNQPPKNLPSGYLPVWQALRGAAERSPSRQALAKQLGVATHTLQRILVDGNVPRFPQNQGTRTVHAWVRTLSRLAARLGASPREWIESAGIPWGAGIQQVSEAALAGSRRRGEWVRGSTDGTPASRRRPDSRSFPGPSAAIRVGIAELPPFFEPLSTSPQSFLANYARRLVGAIAPSAQPLYRNLSERQMVRELEAENSTLDLGVGILGTVYRRGPGLEFLPIPGLGVRLAAACVQIWTDLDRPLRWSELISPSSGGIHKFLVLEDDVAQHHLTGQCGVEADRLIVRSASGPEELAELLWTEVRRSEGILVLVCDEETCRRTVRVFNRHPNVSEGFGAREVETAPGERPRYPLCIAWRSGRDAWSALLGRAQEQELFGSSSHQTAQLYADLIATAYLRSNAREDLARRAGRAGWESAPAEPVGDRAGWIEVTGFQLAVDGFQQTLCHRLGALLIEGITAHFAARAEAGPPDVVHRRVLDRIRRDTDGLVPKSWRGRLEEAILHITGGVDRTTERAFGRRDSTSRLASCLSCSAYLADGVHGGVSDRYCRFCSDERGHLRPRHEVEELLARWIAHWEKDLSQEESRERAVQFMGAMPAWSGS